MVEVKHWNCLLKQSNVMLKQIVTKNMTNGHWKHSWAPPNLDMYLMVEIIEFKTVDVKIQAMVEYWGSFNCL
jgi:hypothetical protein